MIEGVNKEGEKRVTYEEVMTAYRALREQGVVDPELPDGSPEFTAAEALLSRYDNQSEEQINQVPDRARALGEWSLQRNMLFLDAGFESAERYDETIEFLDTDRANALERGDTELAELNKQKIIELLTRAGRGDEIESFFNEDN